MQVIPLKSGVMFKQVFSQAKIFNRFVEDILDIKFQAKVIHTEYEYPELEGYDLFATDEKQRIVVEIQHIKEDDFFDRFLYYHLISLVEQAGGYREYEFQQTVYTIVVLTSTPRDGSVDFSCAISDMNPIDETGKTLAIYPHRLVFLCPRQVNNKTPKRIQQWLRFIDDSLDGEIDQAHYPNPLWQDIMTRIKKRDIDPAVLAEIKDEAAWEKAKIRFAEEARKEGKAEGREEGREEGKIETAQQALIQLLTVKFGTVPDEMIQTIHHSHDLNQLQENWFNQAIIATAINQLKF